MFQGKFHHHVTQETRSFFPTSTELLRGMKFVQENAIVATAALLGLSVFSVVHFSQSQFEHQNGYLDSKELHANAASGALPFVVRSSIHAEEPDDDDHHHDHHHQRLYPSTPGLDQDLTSQLDEDLRTAECVEALLRIQHQEQENLLLVPKYGSQQGHHYHAKHDEAEGYCHVCGRNTCDGESEWGWFISEDDWNP